MEVLKPQGDCIEPRSTNFRFVFNGFPILTFTWRELRKYFSCINSRQRVVPQIRRLHGMTIFLYLYILASTVAGFYYPLNVGYGVAKTEPNYYFGFFLSGIGIGFLMKSSITIPRIILVDKSIAQDRNYKNMNFIKLKYSCFFCIVSAVLIITILNTIFEFSFLTIIDSGPIVSTFVISFCLLTYPLIYGSMQFEKSIFTLILNDNK